jgi:hypothetical protein
VTDGRFNPDEGVQDSSGGPDGADASGTSVSFARDVFPIVRASCAVLACHDTGTIQNHWTDFSTEASTYTRWVNGPGWDFCVDPDPGSIYATKVVVVPGAPNESFLVEKITSTREEPCRELHHPRMPPPPMPPLTPAQIATIVGWISEGALNN